MSLTVYFLRHGQTILSSTDAFCGSGSDPELTPEGLQMADEFAQAYAAKPWTAIYSSTLQRAISTAKPICDATGTMLQIRDEVNEIGYGEWEGSTKAEVERANPIKFQQWLANPAVNVPPQGELAANVSKRGLRLLKEIEAAQDGDVLVVSHKATIRIILCALLGIDVSNFRSRIGCPVASLTIVGFSSHGPMLQVLGDRSHLSSTLRSLPGT